MRIERFNPCKDEEKLVDEAVATRMKKYNEMAAATTQAEIARLQQEYERAERVVQAAKKYLNNCLKKNRGGNN